MFAPVSHKLTDAILPPMMSAWRLGIVASLLSMTYAPAWAQGFGPGRGFVQPAPPPWMFAPPPPGPMQTPRFMSDTAEYCEELAEDIARLRQRIVMVPGDVDMLAADGQRLCEIGHYRPGITRLRTALMILRHER